MREQYVEAIEEVRRHGEPTAALSESRVLQEPETVFRLALVQVLAPVRAHVRILSAQ